MSDQEDKFKCPACGAECPPEAKFCRKCGVSLTGTCLLYTSDAADEL